MAASELWMFLFFSVFFLSFFLFILRSIRFQFGLSLFRSFLPSCLSFLFFPFSYISCLSFVRYPPLSFLSSQLRQRFFRWSFDLRCLSLLFSFAWFNKKVFIFLSSSQPIFRHNLHTSGFFSPLLSLCGLCQRIGKTPMICVELLPEFPFRLRKSLPTNAWKFFYFLLLLHASFEPATLLPVMSFSRGQNCIFILSFEKERVPGMHRSFV